MSTLQKVNINLTSILDSVNCPITFEPMIEAYSILPCNHKVSGTGMLLMKKNHTTTCPLDRKAITQFVEDKNFSYLVQQAVQLDASIKALNNELLTSSKNGTFPLCEKEELSMENPGTTHHRSTIPTTPFEEPKILAYALVAPVTNASQIDKTQPIQVLKSLNIEIQKLKKNAALLTEPSNHSIFIKILDYTSKILTDFPNELLFCNLVYKHAYWVTLQKAEINTQHHNDFGKVSIIENMLPPEYYKDIFYRATIEFYLHYLTMISSRPQFNFKELQEYVISIFNENLSHDHIFSSLFVETLNSYSKLNLPNAELSIRHFVFISCDKTKGDSKFIEFVIKKMKEVWEKD